MARWSETTSGTPPVSHGPSPVAPGYIQVLDLRTYAHCLIILALLLIDFVPRFYQGDSQTYVRTTWEALPPERSWMFGLIANFLLRYTHGYSSFILIQAIFVAAVVIGARRFFQEFVSWQAAYSLTAIALSLDPLLEVSIRFYMTDLLALACFIVCLLGMLAAIEPDASRGSIMLGLSTYVLGAIAAVFLRVAFLPVLELTALFVSLHCWRRLCGSGWTKFALMVCTPVLAAGLLAGANSIIFAKQYPHEFFLTKLSGAGIAGVYAPALKIEDFASAGISEYGPG